MKGNLFYQTAFLLGIMIAIVIGVGFMLPDSFRVERATVIDAAPAKVFDHLNDLRRWREWDPWSRSDPSIQHKYTGQPGIGQTQSWAGRASGEGTLVIAKSSPVTALELDLKARGQSEGHRMIFNLEDLGNRTRITWTLTGPNRWKPIGNLFGLGMESYLGPIYETGLSNLKTVSEGGVLPEPSRPEE